MDGIASGSREPAGTEPEAIPLLAPDEHGLAAGQGTSPFLTLDGFTGPLDQLLILARAQSIDLAGISLSAMLDQLATALR